MASSSFVPQLLINEGELSEILRIINSLKNPEVKIVGELFGLWRNSLIQPVVQLVTGSGQGAKISKKAFGPDGYYHNQIKQYMENEHGLLQIGLWCSGSANRYPKLNRASPEFNLRSSLLPDKGRYVVLMFVDRTRGNLEIEYHIIDRQQLQLSRVANLTAKDVLPGASGFRELRPVFERINYGAMFPSRRDRQARYFSTNMLQTNHHQANHHQPNHHQPPAQITPTNARITPTNTSITPTRVVQPAEQWYESDGGQTLLRNLMNGFQSNDVAVDMSRDSNSRDITLEINRSICLHFPANFPRSEMSLTWLNDTSKFTRNPDEICRTILNRALYVISCETSLRIQRTTTL